MSKNKKLNKGLEVNQVVASKELISNLILKLKSLNDSNFSEEILELEESLKNTNLYGYVWSEPYEGGCFVYPHEDHPKSAMPIFQASK